jgi:hypothetical protein
MKSLSIKEIILIAVFALLSNIALAGQAKKAMPPNFHLIMNLKIFCVNIRWVL